MSSLPLETTTLLQLQSDRASGDGNRNSSTLTRRHEQSVSSPQRWCRALLVLGSFSLFLVSYSVVYSSSGRSKSKASSDSLLQLSNHLPDGRVLLQGFDSLSHNADVDTPLSLRWYCAPDSWNLKDTVREGHGGAWELIPSDSSATGSFLRLHPPAKKDFWRKTYYDPVLVKDDASVAHVTLHASRWYTVTTTFTLTAVQQFDQAGLYLRLDDNHWLKTGIEVVDQVPRLSAVVTNVYSDWSTQPWPNYEFENDAVVVQCQLRLHCRGSSFVVEAKLQDDNDWMLVRIAPLSTGLLYPNDPVDSRNAFQGPNPQPGKIWAGVFAASPQDQKGSYADFTELTVVMGSQFDHTADDNA